MTKKQNVMMLFVVYGKSLGPAITANIDSKRSNAVGVPVNRKALVMIPLIIVARMTA